MGAEIEELKKDKKEMQSEIEFLNAEMQRKEKEAQKREEKLEAKIQLIMNSLGI